MTSKLRGSRLETEVDKCRGECNWNRLSDLLKSIQSKNSGLEKLSNLIEGELCLETYLEKIPDRVHPRPQYYDSLKRAEALLKTAVTENDDPSVVMEAYLLLAKLHYFCGNYNATLHDIEKSRLDAVKTQFTTLRSLKLAAEGYAVKGKP